MSREEYYEILKELHDQTDWNNLESIRNYNDTARRLRSQIEQEEE